MFLSTFFSRMTIILKSKKIYLNANKLSRLVCINDDLEKNKFQKSNFVISFSINVETIEIDFLEHVKKNFFQDDVFEKILKKILNQIKQFENKNKQFTSIYYFYKLNSKRNLLYLMKKFDSNRLFIFAKWRKNLLTYTHDKSAHVDIHRIYDIIKKSAFFSKMRKVIIDCVISCSFCQVFKESIQKSYEKFQLILISSKSLFEMSLNFVIEFFMITQNNNYLMTIIDRFSKYIKLISDIETSIVKNWIWKYWNNVYRFWKVSHRLISDKDSKFISKFWTKLF